MGFTNSHNTVMQLIYKGDTYSELIQLIQSMNKQCNQYSSTTNTEKDILIVRRSTSEIPVRERDYHGDCERSRKSQRLKAARRQPLDRSPSQHNVESRSPSQKRLLKFNTDES